MTRAFIGFIVAIAVLWASNAIAQTAEPQPAAKIVVDPPLAEPLSRGVVFIQYRTENLQIVPVFGPKALDVSPRIGHLHVAVDGAPWIWAETSGGPHHHRWSSCGTAQGRDYARKRKPSAPGSKRRRRIRDPRRKGGEIGTSAREAGRGPGSTSHHARRREPERRWSWSSHRHRLDATYDAHTVSSSAPEAANRVETSS